MFLKRKKVICIYPHMICKCIENEMLMTDIHEKDGSGEQKYTETISDLSGLPASQRQLSLAGFLQVQPNRTLPWATLSPFQGFCFCSGLSCRTEKSVKIHQVFWFRRFCFLASLSLALASWIIVQHRGHALKPLSYRSAFC